MYFPLDVQEIRRNKIYKIQVKCFTTIKEIKSMLTKHLSFPMNRMQLFHSSKTLALTNLTTLHELGIDKEGHSLMLSLNTAASTISPPNSTTQTCFIEPLKLDDNNCKELIMKVKEGFLNNIQPSKTDLLDCTGGVYFLKSAALNNSPIAVFKPHDEEQGMPNNPKGYSGNGKLGNSLRPYFLPGEGYLREFAVYLLDYQHFHNVPSTCIVHCEHPSFNYPSRGMLSSNNGSNSNLNNTKNNSKEGGGGGSGNVCGINKSMFPKLGSLQEFIKATDTFENISPSLISTLELQKIALLDIRTLNNDRNSANILLVRKPVISSATPVTTARAAGGNGNHNAQQRRDSRSGSMTSNGEDIDYETEIDMQDFINRSDSYSSRRYQQDSYECIPIDHGYCLPTKLCIDEFDWTWFNCPQIAQPIEPEIVAYMKSFSIEDLIANLSKFITLSEDSLFLLRLVHNLILTGIEQQLTLKDIASLIVRLEDGVPSPLEKAIRSAEENASRFVAAKNQSYSSLSLVPHPPSAVTSPTKSGRHTFSKSPVSSIVNNVLPISTTRYGNNNKGKASYASVVASSSSSTSTSTTTTTAKPFSSSTTTKDEQSENSSSTTTTQSVFPFRNTNDNNHSIGTANNNSQSNIRKPQFPVIEHPADVAELGHEQQGSEETPVTLPEQDEMMKHFLLTSSYLRPKGQLALLHSLEPLGGSFSPTLSSSSSSMTSSTATLPFPLPLPVMRETSNASIASWSSTTAKPTPTKDSLMGFSNNSSRGSSYFSMHFSPLENYSNDNGIGSGNGADMSNDYALNHGELETGGCENGSDASSNASSNEPTSLMLQHRQSDTTAETMTSAESSSGNERETETESERRRGISRRNHNNGKGGKGSKSHLQELSSNSGDAEEEDEGRRRDRGGKDMERPVEEGGGEGFYPVSESEDPSCYNSIMAMSNSHHYDGQTKIRRVSSFSLLEVQTIEPMRFEPSRPSNNNRRSGSNGGHCSSGNTSEEENEFGGFIDNDNNHHRGGYFLSGGAPLPVHDGNNHGNGIQHAFSQTLNHHHHHDPDNGDDERLAFLPPKNPHSYLLSKQQQQQSQPLSQFTGPLGLTRVTSFNAFESPALYETDANDRHLNRLKREKRKQSHAKSPEFQELRMNFAKEAIVKTIATHVKSNK